MALTDFESRLHRLVLEFHEALGVAFDDPRCS